MKRREPHVAAFFLGPFFFFGLFRATPKAHGGSQTRDQIRTVATGILTDASQIHFH